LGGKRDRRPKDGPDRAASWEPEDGKAAAKAAAQPARPGTRAGRAAAALSASLDAARAGLEAQDAAKREPFDFSGWVPSLKSFHPDAAAVQEAAWDEGMRRRITLFLGPAGTGKTHLAVAMALHELVLRRSVQKVVLCRPAVEAGERLGFLPGDAKAKVDPYMLPCYDMLDDMVGPRGTLREQVNARLEIAPVAFLRGRTFKDTFIVLDEAQNCSWTQLKLAMTRLGRGSRMIVTGDPEQSDLPPGVGANPLARLRDNLKGRPHLSRLGCFVFPEAAIVRDDAVKEVLEAFA
jgi:phosphate starvation-inducible protein PhoH